MTQELFKDLKTPTEGGWEHLMELGVGCEWTEHSKRVTLLAWAGAAGIPDTVCKMLGRWTYDRSVAAQIVRAQMHISQFARQNIGRVDPFGERQVLEKIESSMMAMGYHREVWNVQREKLESYVTIGQPLKKMRWTRGPSEEIGNERAVGQEDPAASSEDDGTEEEDDAAT